MAITLIDLPGRPFEPVTTADGCWIFVSILGSGPRGQAGIAIVGRSGGKFQLKHVIPVNDPLSGIALTHDGKLLIAGIGNGVSFLNPASLISGQGATTIGQIRTSPEKPSASYLSITADDHFLFVSNEVAEPFR